MGLFSSSDQSLVSVSEISRPPNPKHKQEFKQCMSVTLTASLHSSVLLMGFRARGLASFNRAHLLASKVS